MLTKFELPELPSVLTEHVKMVPKEVLSELIAYLQKVGEIVNAQQTQIAVLEKELTALTGNVKTIAEILEDNLYE